MACSRAKFTFTFLSVDNLKCILTYIDQGPEFLITIYFHTGRTVKREFKKTKKYIIY